MCYGCESLLSPTGICIDINHDWDPEECLRQYQDEKGNTKIMISHERCSCCINYNECPDPTVKNIRERT